MHAPKSLRDVLKREGNNFDILRLIAALAVIVGHAYAISPQPPLQDGILGLLHFDYSGSLAVKFFFFLSGLLVTNSILSKPDAFHFLIKRACRIFPGLLVCLLIAVFIVGPLFTTLPLAEYFSRSQTWTYISKNFFLQDLQWRLTGVFDSSANGLNGSLWTLPFEVTCYIYLAILFGLGLLKNKIVANIFFVSIVAVSFVAPNYLPALFSQHEEAHLLPACFAIGSLFAINKDSIAINVSQVVLLLLFSFMLKDSIVFQFIFYIAFFYTTVFIASHPYVINRLKIPFDASYGVYVYGYMIQQCVHASLPGIGVHGNQLVSAAIALSIGVVSWYLVEKPFIGFGNKVTGAGYWDLLKKRVRDLGTDIFSETQDNKVSVNNNVRAFIFLGLAAFIIYVIVLKFIFPGYYSPLYPLHSNLFRTGANTIPSGSFISTLSEAHPVDRIFSRFIGHFGIHGSIGWIIVIVCMNCSLTALFVKRLLKFEFSWQLAVVFALYCYLLFSQPYFYIGYAQDTGSQLAYFFMILGAWLFYWTFEKHPALANTILFCCCLLSFLSKETYVLAALVYSFIWFIYYRQRSFFAALGPSISIIAAFIMVLIVSPHSTGHISLNPATVLREWWLYAKEAVNFASLLAMLLLIYLFYGSGYSNKNKLVFIAVGCLAAGFLSWIPDAVMVNDHYSGNSFNGAYLLYFPLLFFPVLWIGKNVTGGVTITIALLCLMSPFLNREKYKDSNNSRALAEENTQRNFFESIGPLIKGINSSPDLQKVLIEGIRFPFHPFDLSQSLRSFPNAGYASFDVVNYGQPALNGKRSDLVKFISPSDIGLVKYQQKWAFDNDGELKISMDSALVKLFDKASDSGKIMLIDQGNFELYRTSGFYGAENGIRWTSGNAFINLNNTIQNKDSLIIELHTYMPAKCRNITPKVLLLDTANKAYEPALVARKESIFYYLFVFSNKRNIQKINILSGTIDASPDQRILSFPFISLEVKN